MGGRRSTVLLCGETEGGHPMLYTIAIILIILWALGFFAFHVAGGLIHLLIVVAVVMIVINLLSGRRAL
jgi:hypothetical protein